MSSVVVAAAAPATRLHVAAEPLLARARVFCAFRQLCAQVADGGDLGGLRNHVFKLLKRVVNVGPLCAVPLRGDEQVVRERHGATKKLAQALLCVVVQPVGASDVEAQRRLRVEFVYVLAALPSQVIIINKGEERRNKK
jgi:hypothetical protein